MKMEAFIEAAGKFIWGGGMLFLLLGTGLYLSVRLGFFQLRKIGFVFKSTIGSLKKEKEKGGVSQLQTATASLAATMGTGNIVGVAAAISVGGAGAVFWMWVSAILGMALVYGENVLGIKYRIKNSSGEWEGGPMLYLERGLHSKPLAVFYAVACALAGFGMGNLTQSNSISSAAYEAFGVPPVLSGIITAAVAGTVIVGGLKKVGRVTEFMIPFLSLFYMAGAVWIIICNLEALPAVFSDIIKEAFGFSAAAGGFCGTLLKEAVSMGLRKGVFSNEAGLGGSAIVHCAAKGATPVNQGLWGVFEVFLDTVACCTLTAAALLSSGARGSGDGAVMVLNAFSKGLGAASVPFVTVCLILFAFATILGWSCFGSRAAEYLGGKKAGLIYRVIFIGVIIIGAVSELSIVWGLSDVLNGIMAIPNLIGIILLSGEIVGESRGIVIPQRTKRKN